VAKYAYKYSKQADHSKNNMYHIRTHEGIDVVYVCASLPVPAMAVGTLKFSRDHCLGSE